MYRAATSISPVMYKRNDAQSPSGDSIDRQETARKVPIGASHRPAGRHPDSLGFVEMRIHCYRGRRGHAGVGLSHTPHHNALAVLYEVHGALGAGRCAT